MHQNLRHAFAVGRPEEVVVAFGSREKRGSAPDGRLDARIALQWQRPYLEFRVTGVCLCCDPWKTSNIDVLV